MNQKTAKRLSWAIWNGAVISAAVLGVVLRMEMAANVFKFATLLTAPIAILCACSNEASAKLRKKGPSVPPYLSLCVDLALAFMLAAYAWFGYATLIAVSAICLASIFLDETETNTTTPNTDAP